MAWLVLFTITVISMGFYTIGVRFSHSFRCRVVQLIIVGLFACYLSEVFAAPSNAGWDCDQDKNTGEWVCKTDKARQENLPKSAQPENREPTISKEVQPTKTESETAIPTTPVVNSPESPANKAQREKLPEPSQSESVEPVITKEVQPTTPETESVVPVTPVDSAESGLDGKDPKATLHQPDESALKDTVKQTKPSNTEYPPLPDEKVEEKLPSVAKQPGWTCKSDENDAGWNCNLVGPDPAGQSHPVSNVNETVAGTATFTNSQEMIFKDMVSKSAYAPWDKCTVGLGPRPARVSNETRRKSPVDIDADYSDIYDREVISFSGNVDVSRADQRVLADQASYNTESGTLNARGNVHYNDQDFSIYSDSAFLNLDDDQGKLRNSQFIYGAIPARGKAKLADIESKTLSRYIDAAYTTCAPNNQDWTLEAGTLEMDREEGVGTATNAWLEISGVPIMYVPYFEFPIDNRRKSGVLNPVFGLTRDTGFDFTLPYYWNIAPDYDATIIPRLMTNRGMLLGGEFRYLTESSIGHVEGQIIPYDISAKKTRGAFSLVNSSQFTPSLYSIMDINWVSDNQYIDEISNTISLTSFSHIRSFANLGYNQPGFSAFAQLENYQTIDATIPAALRPYRRLPQILVTGAKNINGTDGLVQFRGEHVYFQRNNTVTGHRIDLKPDISWPIETAGAFITPKVAFDFTQYFLQGQQSGTPDSITRALPLVSVDSGLFFERDFSLGGSDLIQTLEPRMYYLYVPDSNQDDIPLFDTSEFDFTILQLFRDNRFNSADRIGDANQLSVAITSRILEPGTGIQRLDGTLGTIAYFANRNVQLTPGIPPDTQATSSIVAELNGLITNNLSFRSGLQWNPHAGEFNRGLASIHYQDEENRVLNLAYRYRQNLNGITEIEQADGSLRWPLLADLAVVGRMQYSILNDSVLESFVGLEKESCCWRFRIIGRYWVQTNSGDIVDVGKANTGVFVQLEFKGFASFGDNVDRFLERNISGYQGPK